jgi:6-phosphogluconolactonase
MRVSRSSSEIRPPSTSATSRRVELVPRSIAATRMTASIVASLYGEALRVLAIEAGRLVAIPKQTANLNGSDPAQVAFSPDGRVLVVTDRANDSIHLFEVKDGRISEQPITFPSQGAAPYGFDFGPDGTLVVTEAAGAQIGKASASSYALAPPAQLNPVSGPVGNTRSEVCWAVIGKDGRYAYVTNFGDGTISTYEIGPDGTLSLRDAVAATTYEGEPGLRDEALTHDGQFLYALHADRRRIFAWEVATARSPRSARRTACRRRPQGWPSISA